MNLRSKDFNLEYFVYHRASSSTWWVVLDTKHKDYGPIMVTTKEPDIKTQDDVSGLTRSMAVSSTQFYEYECLWPGLVYVGNT